MKTNDIVQLSQMIRKKACRSSHSVVFAFLVLAGVTIGVFSDLPLLGDNVVLSKKGLDLFSQFFYWRDFGFQELRQGNLPLWNPHIMSGVPFLGGFQSALLYPPNFVFLATSTAQAVNIVIILHVLFVGLFMYLWTAYRRLHPYACLLSSILVMFCGSYFMRVYAGHLPHLCTMTWVPLVLLAIDGLTKKPTLGWSLLGAAAVSMQILAGYPQHVYYTLATALLYCALCLLKSQQRLKTILLILLMATAPLFLTALQVLPGLEVADQTVRSDGLPYRLAGTFSFPPEGLAGYLVPGLFGNDIDVPYWGRWYVWETLPFLGVTGFFFAVYGAIYGRPDLRRFSITMAIFLILIAMGKYTPLFRVLYTAIPGFNLFRGSTKLLFQASLFMIMLSGVGIDHLIKNRTLPRRIAALVIILSGVVGIGALAVHIEADQAKTGAFWKETSSIVNVEGESFLPAETYHNPEFIKKATTHSARALSVSFSTLLVLGILLWISRSYQSMRLLIPLLAALEIVIFARNSRATFHVDTMKEPGIEAFLTQHPGDYRILNLSKPNRAMVTGRYNVWGYDSVVLRRYAEFMTYTQGLPIQETDQYVSFSRFPESYNILRCRFAFIPGLQEMKILENGPVMPRLSFLDKYDILTEKEQILKAITAPSFDPRETIILESSPDPKPVVSPLAGTAKLVEASTDHMIIEASLPQPKILLITDTYSEGWRVIPLLEDRQSEYEILRADYMLRAIPLAAGRHRILLEYEPQTVVVGTYVSIVSVFLYFGALGYVVLRTRNKV